MVEEYDRILFKIIDKHAPLDLRNISCKRFVLFTKNLKIKGKAFDWFKSYLENRQQCANINNTKSELCALKFGVPQGSVLGPILFSLHTLPLADILKKRCTGCLKKCIHALKDYYMELKTQMYKIIGYLLT